MGTGAYGVPALEALHQSRHAVAGVLTSPDKPRGRHLELAPSPIGEAAARLGLPVRPFVRSESARILEWLRALRPDFLVTVSFGFILSGDLLSCAARAPLNIHPSLLPRHRGASPMPWTILSGDPETGVTVIRMNERMDAGNIVAQERTPVAPGEGLISLEKRLRVLGAQLIVRVLDDWEKAEPRERSQDESQATYTRKFSKEDARLDFALTAPELERRVHAFQGWPGTFARVSGKRLIVHEAEALTDFDGPPGQVLAAGADGIVVAARSGALRLRIVQMEGRRPAEAADFLRGFKLKPGDRFE